MGLMGCKRRRFLMLCFVKPGDLKTVLQKFSRSGIRCKIREAKTGAGEASLARTSSVVSAGSQGSQEGHRPGLTRALSSQPMRAATSWFIPTAMPLKRPHSENPPDAERSDRMKRRQTSIAHDAHSPSLLRRESSQDDTLASPWTPAIKCTGGRPQSQTPRLTRLSSGPPHHRFRDFPMQANANSPANEEVDEPPPRRELPQSITRHISLPSSQAEGTNSRSASGGSRRIAVAVAEMEVQTEEPFVEPEDALFAGMDLFHELLALKDKMIKECLNMTLLLGGRANGASDEAEARLAARYAIEFQSRSVEIFAQHANSYLA
ncbi:hypothetical protein SCUCBS95973_005015 [Sporothrix curviconia]|uniref:Uncharacterized protein n=1 Tax=Sporothrix curviconia TaxID=1260050 RepID=A0ABP0BTN4_9PEZI